MSQFFTLSFELSATEAKAEKITHTVREYLANQGAKDILFTHSGDPEESEDESEQELPKSRRR